MKTFSDQCKDHIQFLQDNGLAVEELQFGQKGVTCHSIGSDKQKRGKYWYKSVINQMGKGKVGIVTNIRGPSGKSSHKTYGKSPTGQETVKVNISKGDRVDKTLKEEAIKKATKLFEEVCFKCSDAPYLISKGVKAYGVKCIESSEYGRSVVVPARDINGNIVSCLYLNPDGSKMWSQGEIVGSFHALAPLDDAEIIGICEGYATAATCMSVFADMSINVSVVATFGSWNLKKIGLAIRERYPEAKIIFFADNDKHLVTRNQPNDGLEAARIASNEAGGVSTYLEPKFSSERSLKQFSDWNDLARVHGMSEVMSQILRFLRDEMWL